MSLNVEFQFDSTLRFSWEASDIKTAIESVAFLHQLPARCPECDAPLNFFFRSPKGFSYYGMECGGSPQHQVNFGQHKEGGGLFYDPGKWELAYKDREGGGQQSGGTPAQPGSAASAQPASQPSQSAPGASPKGDKAPIANLNMIGAVARAKKVSD